jgi:multimeric flavodoxin WrbA
MKPIQDKHVIMLDGSTRKATTHRLLTEIATLLTSRQIQVTMISLSDYQIQHCVGCERCIRETSACFQEDDARAILSQLVAADGFVLASPVYIMNVTGKLKSLMDKTASWVHRPPLVAKPVLLAATTAGSGLDQVLDYMEQVTIQWGAHPTGKIGRSATKKHPVSQAELDNLIWHLRNAPHAYRPSVRQLTLYQVQKVLALKVSALDRAYWTERGWDKQPYYYPCRISLVRRWIAWSVYQVLYRRVQPVNPF